MSCLVKGSGTMVTHTLEDLLEESRKIDVLKEDAPASRKELSVGFYPVDGPKKFQFYLSSPDGSGNRRKLLFTPYAWRQLWQRLFHYPVSGVSTRRIPEHLIRQIASSRIERLQNLRVTLKVLKDSIYQSSGGLQGSLYLRGYVTTRRHETSVTKLLSALVLSPIGDYYVSGTKSGMSETVYRLPLIEKDYDDDEDTSYRFGYEVSTSELGVSPASMDLTADFPDKGAYIILRKFGLPLFALGSDHKDVPDMASSFTKALTKGEEYKTEASECISQAAKFEITKIEPTLLKISSTHSLNKEITSAVRRELDRSSKLGIISRTKLGISIAMARTAKRYDQETKFRIQTAAGGYLLSDS
jgi:hypothetical protein